MDAELRARVESLRSNFLGVTGSPFKHFFCPILLADEDVEIIRGHVVNQAFKTSNAWLPQRRDVDNFFGSMAESSLVAAVTGRQKSAIDIWFDPKTRRIYRPKLEAQGKTLDYYFTSGPILAPGHTPGRVIGPSGEFLCNVAVKHSSEELRPLHGSEVKIDATPPPYFVPAIVASVLKAAHLTMFGMLGYSYVFSATGQHLAAILGDFFRRRKDARKAGIDADLDSDFRSFAPMVSPMILVNRAAFAGTVIDNRLLAVIGGTEGMFAIGVVVPAGPDDAFCVWLPSQSGKTIDTYLGFLNEPPPSIAVKPIQFVPANANTQEHWITPDQEPIRISLAERIHRG